MTKKEERTDRDYSLDTWMADVMAGRVEENVQKSRAGEEAG